MPAWIEDAQFVDDEEALGNDQSNILLKTQQVYDYLDSAQTPQNILVAPKGFGKTFLLKLKRIRMQESGFFCLPTTAIVERPVAIAPNLTRDKIELLRSTDRWEALWQFAIAIAILASVERQGGATPLSDLKQKFASNTQLIDIIENGNVGSAFSVLHTVLASRNKTDLFRVLDEGYVANDYFSMVHEKIALFIDNIDEYLETYLNIDRYDDRETTEEYLDIWHAGQVGAWRAVRRLAGMNQHVKVFMTMRREAYHYANTGRNGRGDPSFANLKSTACILEYSRSQIAKIITNNIEQERRAKLAAPNEKNPILRFVGREGGVLDNLGTGSDENLEDYWLRHCTGSPREVVAIGGAISKIEPEERLGPRIRNVVNEASRDRVQTILNEVSPFVRGFYPEYLPQLLKKNALSRSEVEEISAEYKALAEANGDLSENASHIFCTLYTIGLIGVVRSAGDQNGRMVQVFSPPGSIPLGSRAILPNSDVYLLHPSLTDYLIAKDGAFFRGVNHQNVVGDGLEWRQEESRRFVVIGDLCNYKDRIMNKPGEAATFGAFFQKLFKQSTLNIDMGEIIAGDSFMLADRNHVRLARALKMLRNGLARSNYAMEMRAAGHCGFWHVNNDVDGGVKTSINQILAVAARVEPKLKTNELVVTEAYNRAVARGGAKVEPREVRNAEVKGTYTRDKGLKISKPNEAEEWTRLFVIE